MARTRTLRALLATIVLLTGAVAAYEWDAANAGQIAAGVRVADVDLGGIVQYGTPS